MLGTEKIKLECILAPLLCVPCTAVSNLMCHKCNLWVLFALKYMFLVHSLECKNLQCLLQEVQNNFTKSWDSWCVFNKFLNNDIFFFNHELLLFLKMKATVFLSEDKFKSQCYNKLCTFSHTYIIQSNFYCVFNKHSTQFCLFVPKKVGGNCLTL